MSTFVPPLSRGTPCSAIWRYAHRAAYFRQVEYGMCVRMALRMMVLGKA